ncbi:MAG: RnfABCDGE type electron transport complex subunit D [Clostridia bacterium]|nr:RnfABCDGE type electron transport complex subunit D [Clostridia bacterium]MBQ6425670.1 RnfABCDGE type electron transport complex subunit D [Clostridia bacterium]MBR0517072.1 RnfABCDGE type electron transport complex subunit D [Bacillota bacterium]
MNTALNLSSGPHVRDRWTTRFIMHVVVLTLLPAAAVGVYVYGLKALWIILASVITAVGTEFFFDKLTGRPDTWMDGSAMVTGLMLALTLSADTPLYVPVIGSIFAILVVKCAFGGLGKNFVNPALAARCFLLISFPSTMTMYSVDAVSSATPVAELSAGNVVNITKMFLGSAGGVIGSSIIALLIGGMILWALDIIHGQICFSVLAGFVVFLGLFGGKGFDPYFLLAHLCGGGVILGAFFMATDYVTSPVSRLGQTVYGVMIGVIGAMFRVFGTAADSFSYSIIIANLFVPLIDTYIVSKPYAFRKKAIAIQNGEEKKPLLQRIPKPVIALTVIALVAGLALSGAYSVTKDTIEEQRLAANKAAYQAVVPDANSFEALDEQVSALGGEVYGSGFGRVYINEAVRGTDAGGNLAGYAISVTSNEGYDGTITLYVGVSADGTVNSISFTELHETPGKGMICGEPAFKDQFSGAKVSSFTLNSGSGDAKIDGVTGATVTSRAVVNAVNAALDFYQNSLKGGA